MTNSPGHLWRDNWTALSGPLSVPREGSADFRPRTAPTPLGTRSRAHNLRAFRGIADGRLGLQDMDPDAEGAEKDAEKEEGK